MPSRVTFRSGPFTPSGERVVHGLVVCYDALDCVNDNAHRLEDADFPVDGSIIAFGSHRMSPLRRSNCPKINICCEERPNVVPLP
ncbi:DNA mismatch repair protein Mlh1 [Hordeum vulgare]|nr:DNA mismatch repair protein Mlh1 [Hordeum vulgare]